MPDDGFKLRDVSVLADEAAEVSIEVPIARLVRLAGGLADTAGTARAEIRFERRAGFAAAQVRVAAQVVLVCQRCLQPMTVPLDGDSLVLLPTSEQDAERAPPDAEMLLAPEGRLRLAGLVEEELLLALPFAPLHGQGEGCRGQESEAPAPAAVQEDVQRPFAALGDLLGRGGS